MARPKKPQPQRESLPARLARKSADWTGTTPAFVIALLIILGWLVTGPFFDYSNTWQLIINTGTTIVTFLMVFLIQRSQNKDSHAIQMKLNELIASTQGASNRLINAEDLSEGEIRILHQHFARLVELAEKEGDILQSHSVEEASERSERKKGKKKC